MDIPAMERIAETVWVRPATPADEPFLAELYRSTRDDFAVLQADPALIDLLIRQQRDAQIRGYALAYPQASHLLIAQQDAPIGRAVVNFGQETIHLVDLSLVPAARRHGHGTAVLRWLQHHAATTARPLTLMVQHHALDAARLYAALGFTVTEHGPVIDTMMWRGTRSSLNASS